MAVARWEGKEFEVVYFTSDADWVLRDQRGDTVLLDGDKIVEVRCDRCGRWSAHAIPAGAGKWACADSECYDLENEGGR